MEILYIYVKDFDLPEEQVLKLLELFKVLRFTSVNAKFYEYIKVIHVSSSYIVILLFCTATWIWAITELQTCHRRLSYFPGEKNRVCDSLLQLNFNQFKFCLTVGYLFIYISLQIPGGVDLC